MKIVCIDKNIDYRTELKILLQSAFDSALDSLSQPQVDIYSLPLEELLVNSTPDVLCFYAKDKIDATLLLYKELNSVYPDIPKAVFLNEDLYNLKNLNKFESYACETFSASDKAVTIVHKLFALSKKISVTTTGALINVLGAKGGVGVSTITASLAHAFSAYGKRAIIVDLSPTGSLLHYIGSDKSNSLEYTTLLKENTLPDHIALEHLLVTAPNGITGLLSPLGGTDVRELWLRDTQRFEITLALIETLKKRFDMVLIDSNNSEGILNFALQSRANINLLITSTDPASIHQLNQTLSNLFESPGEFEVKVLINNINKSDLNKEDVLDFLWANPNYHEEIFSYPEIPFDLKGTKWIGSGNTFYTECNSKTRSCLELIAYSLLVNCGLVHEPTEDLAQSAKTLLKNTLLPSNKKISDTTNNVLRITSQLRALPPVTAAQQSSPSENGTYFASLSEQGVGETDEESKKESVSNQRLETEEKPAANMLFSVPQNQTPAHGNITLEVLLFIAGAIVCGATMLPTFFENLKTEIKASYSEPTVAVEKEV
ncbi:MAG: AAA family ATPase [Deltaproteobacteria bacterium]|jgi:cellulose biosynthesis protein BcsQ|nr:AAA family ATPase [Deltaproteobacteria bacterium]